jgi:nitrous oxidase accessory protein NosD
MLFSSVPWQAVVQMPSLPPLPTDLTLAIVRVNGAKNTTIRDFTITGPGAAGCNSLRYGVRVDNGGSSTIVGNHITEIHDTPFSGCQNGVGVLVGRSLEMQTASALVVHNVIDKYQKGGVVVDGVMAGGSSWAEVAYNLVDGVGVTGAIAQNGIQISQNAIGYVHHNLTSRNNYLFLDTVSEGILLFGEKPNATVVSKNYSFLNDDGVDLYTSQGTKVSYNLLLKNDFDGIYAGVVSASNKISYNRAENNAEDDCFDDSIGMATAGTANFWFKNFGKTENKPGLCKGNSHW